MHAISKYRYISIPILYRYFTLSSVTTHHQENVKLLLKKNDMGSVEVLCANDVFFF